MKDARKEHHVTDDELAELAHEVRLASMSLTRRIKENTRTLPPHLFTVLAWLENRPSTAGELATRERVSAPAMSKSVCELEDRGLIDRAPDPGDARAKIVSLNESGRAALAEGRRQRDTWMVDQLRDCTDEELRALRVAAAILDKVVKAR